jgi:hypothetical protein
MLLVSPRRMELRCVMHWRTAGCAVRLAATALAAACAGCGSSEGGAAVLGRVCSVIDLRDPYACQPGQQVGGISVAQRSPDSGVQVETLEDGSFGLDPSSGADAIVLEVAAASDDRRTSLVRVPLVDGRARGVIVPVVTRSVWDSLTTFLGIEEEADRGAIVLQVLDGGEPAIGMVVVPPEGTTGPVYYEAGGPFVWSDTGPTSHSAVALVPGVPAGGDARLLIREFPDSAVHAVDGMAIAAGALTFEAVDVQAEALSSSGEPGRAGARPI